MPLHRFLQELNGSFAISSLSDDAFQHLAYMIDSAPEVVRRTVDLHVDLVEVPVAASAHRPNSLPADIGR